MPTVVLNGRELKDYWAIRKAERKRMALYYQENSQVTVKMVMTKFHVSRHTLNKALEENGVAVDRSRNPAYSDRGSKQHRCLDCGETYRHYCKPKTTVELNPDSMKLTDDKGEPFEVELDDQLRHSIAVLRTQQEQARKANSVSAILNDESERVISQEESDAALVRAKVEHPEWFSK